MWGATGASGSRLPSGRGVLVPWLWPHAARSHRVRVLSRQAVTERCHRVTPSAFLEFFLGLRMWAQHPSCRVTKGHPLPKDLLPTPESCSF